MKATILLADAAQVADGKLNVLGGGWIFTGPQPTPSAIALLIDVPWTEANRRHSFSLQLFTVDGTEVMLPGPEGTSAPLKIENQFEIGRPPGWPQGSDLRMPFAMNLGPLPIGPGRYEWRLTINGETKTEWCAPFTMRERPVVRQ